MAVISQADTADNFDLDLWRPLFSWAQRQLVLQCALKIDENNLVKDTVCNTSEQLHTVFLHTQSYSSFCLKRLAKPNMIGLATLLLGP